jgi:hypothetical protein
MSRFKITAASVLLAAACITQAETVSIPLSGTGTGSNIADLLVNPPLLDAGFTQVATQLAVQFELRHIGGPEDADLEIRDLQIGGEHASDFQTEFSTPLLLAPGAATTLDLTFLPSAEGVRNAWARVYHNGRNSPHFLLLTGNGTGIPTSELTSNTGEFKNFGDTPENQPSTASITIGAQGNGQNAPPVTVTGVLLSGPGANAFSTDFSNQVTLNPGQTLDIAVTLNSSIAGQKNAQLQVQHDGENNPFNIQLQGNISSGGGETLPEFNAGELLNAWPYKPTSLDFGPDGNLYVAEQSGLIHVYTVSRTGTNTYTTTQTETLSLVQDIPNHDDDGSVNNEINQRLITGILVAGSADDPIVYVTSGDPRIGAGPSGTDLGLDTNSGVISKLQRAGNQWNKIDLVRGLPRSEENHQPNGMQLSADGSTLFVSLGGHTNMGAPSNNFAELSEYSYSAAIATVDLAQIGNSTYDLPTLDDEDRAGSNDANDPFGGNNGKNMAVLESGSPVQIYAPGFRNAFDLVITSNGKMYTVDNGPNSGWGGVPPGNCLNAVVEGGQTYGDGLHLITGPGYYGGHPNPVRGNTANTFNASNPQSPVQVPANPVECNYQIPESQDGALHVFSSSTNGLTEFTASNFGGAMTGDLLTASFDQSVHRVQLNSSGDQVTGVEQLFTGLGIPLDVVALGDSDPFPGTVWVADYAHIFEPTDY